MHTKGLCSIYSYFSLASSQTFSGVVLQAKTNGTENTILEKNSNNANYEQEEFEHVVVGDHAHGIRIQSKSTFMIFVKY